MKDIDDIINNYKNILNNYKFNEEILKKDAIDELLELRKRAIRLVNSASKKLEQRQVELRKINEMICVVNGHSFTEWKEHEGFLDRSWYYTRNCEDCGHIERRDDEPIEYRMQLLKKRKK